MAGNIQSALRSYGKVANESAVLSATPYRLIQMLMSGALDKIAAAKGHIERGDFAKKAAQISWAISIVNGLRSSLDHKVGGDIAANLDALYDYMVRRLMETNISNDIEGLNEVARLLATVKSGWDAIPDPAIADSRSAAAASGVSA